MNDLDHYLIPAKNQKHGVTSDHLDIPVTDLEKCFKKENGKKNP